MPIQPSQIARVDISHIATLSNLFQHISFEEFDLITDCKDPELKELMVLNRAKHVQIKALITKYTEMLADCEDSLRFHEHNIQKIEPLIRGNLRLNRCGFPYFNYNQFRPPNNPDYFRKKQANIVNLNYVVRRQKASVRKTTRLRTCVLFHYVMQHENRDVLGDISDENAMVNISKVKPPALYDDTHINWHTIAENDFGGEYLHDVHLVAY